MPARRKTAADVVFGLPGALVDAVQKSLSPDQRQALNADAAHQLLEICNETAGKVGKIIESLEVSASPPRKSRAKPKSPNSAGETSQAEA